MRFFSLARGCSADRRDALASWSPATSPSRRSRRTCAPTSRRPTCPTRSRATRTCCAADARRSRRPAARSSRCAPPARHATRSTWPRRWPRSAASTSTSTQRSAARLCSGARTASGWRASRRLRWTCSPSRTTRCTTTFTTSPSCSASSCRRRCTPAEAPPRCRRPESRGVSAAPPGSPAPLRVIRRRRSRSSRTSGSWTRRRSSASAVPWSPR